MSDKGYAAPDEYGTLYKGMTLKQAAQAARESGGKVWASVDRDGAEAYELTDIDPYAPEFDTKADLRRRLEESQARVASERQYKEKALEAHASYQKNLIDAGLIPIELLGEFMKSWHIRTEDIDGHGFSLSMARMMPAPEITATAEFQMPPAGTAGHHAINTLINYHRTRRS